tara:strand:+ start:503 stop:685 length:183 start_codon:yes stop_codon:yes gene_type:complete
MEKFKQNTQKDYEHVELILKEAKAYGLEQEVKLTAKKYIERHPLIELVEAYQHAYNDWIK